MLVEIPEGASTSDVGHELADAGVISNATVWDWYIRFRDPGEFQAGGYRMQLNSSFTEAIDALKEGALPNAILITVPEGLTLSQTLARLADPEDGVSGFTAEGLQAALRDPASRSSVLPADQRSLEGTLFPESYEVEEGDIEAVVIQRMVAQLDSTLAELDMERQAQALGLSPYQVLTVASLIEEEAGTDEDRPRVARVIYKPAGRGDAAADRRDQLLHQERAGGLPSARPTSRPTRPTTPATARACRPAPIASSGRASIEAALNPADGDWLYYVLDAEADDGSHLFTADYDVFRRGRAALRSGLGCG